MTLTIAWWIRNRHSDDSRLAGRGVKARHALPVHASFAFMSPTLLHALHALWITTAALLVLATFLSVLPKALSPMFCRAPMLDLIVASLTWVPWVMSGCIWGWAGFAGTLVGQFVALYVWAKGHELAHPSANKGPRIVKFINAAVGRWQ